MLIYKNLTLRYKDKTIFYDLNGDLKPGELVGILGPNGSGKSSFMKCLGGLLSPTHGEILLNNKLINTYDLPLLSQLRSYGRADINCEWNLSVMDILKLHPFMQQTPTDGKIAEIMDLIQASFLQEKMFRHLSGGEKSLLFLGLTLLQDTPLIFLDEITAMMDEYYANHTLKILQKLALQGKSIMIILHDYQLANTYCEKIIKFSEPLK